MMMGDFSFLPEGYLHRRPRRRTHVIGISLLCVVGIGVALAALVMRRALNDTIARHQQVSDAYAIAEQEFSEAKRSVNEQQKMFKRAKLAISLTDSVSRSRVVAELANALPHGAMLLDLTMESQARGEVPINNSDFENRKAALEARQKAAFELPQKDVRVQLSGLAQSDQQVAKYLAHLNESPLFRDVSLTIGDASTSGSGPKRTFQIQMMLAPYALGESASIDQIAHP